MIRQFQQWWKHQLFLREQRQQQEREKHIRHLFSVEVRTDAQGTSNIVITCQGVAVADCKELNVNQILELIGKYRDLATQYDQSE